MDAHRNVLILYTDQQRWDALGANGNLDIRTPFIDKLASGSCNFDHCFVQSPICMPSRVSFLTGRYPSSLGITHMGVPVPNDTVTIATIFGRYGYRCSNLGKLHFLPHGNRDHTRCHPAYGFHHLEISDEPGVYEDSYRAWVRQVARDQLDHLSVGLPPARKAWLDIMGIRDGVKHPSMGEEGRFDFAGAIPFPGRDDVTHTAWVGNRVCAELERCRRQNEPWVCIAGFYSPHSPWICPDRFIRMYDAANLAIPQLTQPETPTPMMRRMATQMSDPFSEQHLKNARQGYYALISEVDQYVGEILETIDRLGLAEETIVVFTSDHGEMLGENYQFGKGYPAYDGCSRVPLIIRVPAMPPRRVSRLVEAIDVLPTLLELAGLPVSSDLQGCSLAELIRDPSAEGPRRSALTEHVGWRSLRTEEYRYVLRADGEESLFREGPDVASEKDLACLPEYQEALINHRKELALRMIRAEKPIDRSWAY